MSLHLLKLCVGCDSVGDLKAAIRRRLKGRRKAPREYVHVTRMTPKRAAELLDGGSLYWVIRGDIACRQRLLALRPLIDGEGIRRCGLVLEPRVVAVEPRACRPFQGWRYLTPAAAPHDSTRSRTNAGDMPAAMRRELRDLGLL